MYVVIPMALSMAKDNVVVSLPPLRYHQLAKFFMIIQKLMQPYLSRLKYSGALIRQQHGSFRPSAWHRTRWLVLALHSAPAASCRA